MQSTTTDNYAALADLFQQHRNKFVRVALRITRNHEEAEDVVQEAALRAILNLRSFRGESRLDTWVHTIIGNCAISQLRSPSRHRLVSLHSEMESGQDSPGWVALDSALSPEQYCARYELFDIVRSEVEGLKASYRSPIQLCDLEGWSYLEAAGVLKISLPAIKARLSRGRRILRDRLLKRVLGSELSPLVVRRFWVYRAKLPRHRKSGSTAEFVGKASGRS